MSWCENSTLGDNVMYKKCSKSNEMDFIAYSCAEMLKQGVIKDIHQLTRNMPPQLRQNFFDSLKNYMPVAEAA